MKINFFLTLFFIFIACRLLVANDVNKVVNEIDKEVDSINCIIDGLKEIEKDIYGKYSEPDAEIIYSCAKSVLKVFYNSDGVYKLSVKYTGGRDELISEYFCKDGNIIYVRKKYINFDPPKWEEKSKIKKIVLNEYYIKNGEIIFNNYNPHPIWYNEQGGVDLTKKIKEIQKDVKAYLNFLSPQLLQD